MSRKRNRNITGKWSAYPQVTKNVLDGESYFGGSVSPIFQTQERERHNRRNGDFLQNNYFREVSFESSSSSSLSGNEDFESEATKKIDSELQRMNRVLKGHESIPKHYNEDEYKQWMTFFPSISLWDDSDDTEVSNTLAREPYRSGNGRCNVSLNSNFFQHFNFVSSNTSGGPWRPPSKLYNRKSYFYDLHETNLTKTPDNVKEKTTLDNGLQIERFFKPPLDLPLEVNKADSELEKVRALSRSEALSSKWMKRDDNERSLPQIFSASMLSARRSARQPNKEKQAVKTKSVILPPITNNNNRLFSKDNQLDSPKKRLSGKSTPRNNPRNSSRSIRWEEIERKNGNAFR